MTISAAGPDWHQGMVQVYTGEGKGKSTAAFGLALRMAGTGRPVYIGQFIKADGKCGELNAFSRFSDLITVRQFGRGLLLGREPTPADTAAARAGVEKIRETMAEARHRLIILDEANVAVHLGLLPVELLLALIKERPSITELVITGRNAHPEVIKKADLVTEMQSVKHYWQKGVPAREGIEK